MCRQCHDCISSANYISIMNRPLDRKPGIRRTEVTQRIVSDTFLTRRHLRNRCLPLFSTSANCFRYCCLALRNGHVYSTGYLSSAASAAEKRENRSLRDRKCREISQLLDKSGGAIYRTRVQRKFVFVSL